MKLYHSLSKEEFYRLDVINKGLFAKDKNEYSGENKAILVQHTPFVWGTEGEGEFIIIEFEKKLNEVYIDYDDDIEAWDVIKKYSKEERPLTYEGIPESELDKFSLYGSYVKEIKPEEIKEIHTAEFRTDGRFLVDGKPM